jgi:hypothetical protein
MFRGVISRSDWGAAWPSSDPGPQAQDQGLILHWEGPRMWGDLWAFAHDSCYGKVRGIQNYHMTHGYSDIAYNFVICPHGFIFEGRGGAKANAASGDYDVNHHTIAVCFLWGEGDEIIHPGPGNDSIDALNALRNYSLAPNGPLSWEVRPHRAIVQTACPGDTLAFIAGVLNGQPQQDIPAPPPKEEPKTPAGDPILYLNSPNWLAICDWQKYLKAPINGIYDAAFEQFVRDFQAFFKFVEEYPAGFPIVATKCWEVRRFLEALPVPAPKPPLFTPEEINKIVFVIGSMGVDPVKVAAIKSNLEGLTE